MMLLERQHTTPESRVGSSGALKLQFPFFSAQTDPGLLNGRLHPLALCLDLLFALFNSLGLSIFALLSVVARFC